MAAPLLVKSIPFMPERAWTTCVSNGAISGLARSNYVPFAPQPLPPGMTEAMYELLDPGSVGFGAPPPDDCFPRYVMWREERIPDFDGGQPRINWTRNLGWDFRDDCRLPPLVADFIAVPNPVFLGNAVLFTPTVSGGTPPYFYQWQFEDDVLWDDVAAFWSLDELGGPRLSRYGQFDLQVQNGVTQIAGVVGGAASFDDTFQQRLYRVGSPKGAVPLNAAFGITLLFAMRVKAGAPVGATYFFNGQLGITYITVGTANSTPVSLFFDMPNGVGQGAGVGTYVPAYDVWYWWTFKYDPVTKQASVKMDAGAWTAGVAMAGPDPTIGGSSGANIQIGGSTHHDFYSRADMDHIALFNAVKSDADIAAIQAGAGFPGSNEEIPSWTYGSIGIKHATLTVTDSLGDTAFAEHDVLVQDVAPPTSAIYFTWAKPGETLGVTLEVFTVGIDIGTIDWDYGEGGGWVLDTGSPIAHGYAADGTYTIKVRVTDAITFEVFEVSAAALLIDAMATVGGSSMPLFFTWDQPAGDTTVFFDLDLAGSDLTVLTVDWDFGQGGDWELDLGPGVINGYLFNDERLVKVRVNAVEGTFEDYAVMTTNSVTGQTGSSE